MSREGQTRVEIKPGAFVWMDEAAQKRWEASRATDSPVGVPVERATTVPTETAVSPAAKAQAKPTPAREPKG